MFSGVNYFPILDTESCQKNSFPLQRQICGDVSRKSLITDADSLLNSINFHSRYNSVIISATNGIPHYIDEQLAILSAIEMWKSDSGGGVVLPHLVLR